jgi:hypothetical protein
MTNADFGIGRIGSPCIAERLRRGWDGLRPPAPLGGIFLPINLHMQVFRLQSGFSVGPVNPQT